MFHVEKTGTRGIHGGIERNHQGARGRERETRGPHSWLLYRHEVRPRWPRLGEGGGQRGGRSEESVGLPHSRDDRPSLEGVGGVAILRSSGCKTCQNPDLTASPPRLSIPPHWVTTPPRILSISIRNSLESLLWKTWHFEEKTIELFSSFFFFYYYYYYAWKFNDEVFVN